MLEWRMKHALSGMIIYIISTIFICYISFRNLADPPAWNALFWIILLFAAVNATAKSFLQESRGLQLFYYLLFHPQHIILSKIIYNTALLIFIGLLTFLFYSLFLGNQVQDPLMFAAGIAAGSTGFASVLTLVSALASKAGGNPSLMAILSFPVLLPLLMTVIHFTKNAMDGLSWSVNFPNLAILLSVDALTITLACLLFPYLWRE